MKHTEPDLSKINPSQWIDDYIAKCPESTASKLSELRNAIKDVVPEVSEAVSYKIPTFRLNGKNMLHYAAYEHHIGLYATPDGHAEFEEELNQYKRGKGSVQFPLEQPLPLDLITRIALFRAAQLR